MQADALPTTCCKTSSAGSYASRRKAVSKRQGYKPRSAILISKHHLQSELHLARRARFASRKPSRPDHAERCAARRCSQTRVAEIRMVEEIEYLRAELGPNGFLDCRVFEDRKID